MLRRSHFFFFFSLRASNIELRLLLIHRYFFDLKLSKDPVFQTQTKSKIDRKVQIYIRNHKILFEAFNYVEDILRRCVMVSTCGVKCLNCRFMPSVAKYRFL